MRKGTMLVVEKEEFEQGILLRSIASNDARKRKINIIVTEIAVNPEENRPYIRKWIGRFWWYLNKYQSSYIWEELKISTEEFLEEKAPEIIEFGFPEIAVDRDTWQILQSYPSAKISSY